MTLITPILGPPVNSGEPQGWSPFQPDANSYHCASGVLPMLPTLEPSGGVSSNADVLCQELCKGPKHLHFNKCHTSLR